MKRLVTGLISAACLGGTAHAGQLTLQLKWLTQAQFAGYYVAQDKGFYREEGLDITILPGGPGISAAQVLAHGDADVIVEWMPAALVAREKGLPLVNIAQPFRSSGMMLTCLKASTVAVPATDLPGKAVGAWFSGNEYPLLAWMGHLGLSATGGPDGVTLLDQGAGPDLLLNKQAACISAMSYNEYGLLLDAGLTPEDLTTFSYEDQGAAMLEDGLYVLETTLKDPAKRDDLTGFVRASMKGWRYVEEHPEEAAGIVLEHDDTGKLTLPHQTRMAREIATLTRGGDGRLDEAAYQRTVDFLLHMAGPSPLISAAPEGAYTHLISDRAAVGPEQGPVLPPGHRTGRLPPPSAPME